MFDRILMKQKFIIDLYQINSDLAYSLHLFYLIYYSDDGTG